MKTNNLIITYKGRKYVLKRTESKYYQIGFEADRWTIHIYLLREGSFRILINKSIKKSETEYHLQFCYDCYCTLSTATGLFLNDVSDPATCKRIKNSTKWFVIEPILREIYTRLKDEIHALHPFDLIRDRVDLELFIYQKMKEYGTTEYTVNDTLRFGIGENAYAKSEEAILAKEKEPLVLLNLFNGHHIISKDTIVFFLYWLSDRDGNLTVSDGKRTKIVVK